MNPDLLHYSPGKKQDQSEQTYRRYQNGYNGKKNTQSLEALEEIQGRRSVKIGFSPSPGNLISIRVSNNGPGIPSELHDKIFVPFFYHKKGRIGDWPEHIAGNCAAP